jgi:hypothetical protein
MGRFDDAFALGFRLEKAKGGLLEQAEATVNRRLASHRISAAIRRGDSLQRAVGETPSTDPGVLFISARELLGRSPYGMSTMHTASPEAQTLIVVADIAEMIAVMARDETGRARISHLVYAAELQATLGNRAKVVQLLEQIPHTEDPIISFSEDIVRLIGSETAIELYRNVGGNRPNLLLTAASVEPDELRAIEYLDQAYEAFSAEVPWPDFDWMERTIEHSAHLGNHEHALQLAQNLAQKAQTEPSAFPVFSHIRAARALMTAKAKDGEIRQTLVRAESAFPSAENELVGVGVVSGPIFWGRSGFDAQARREIANLRAQLGDVDISIRMMEGIESPVFAWNDMITADIPVEHLNTLLENAEAILTVAEYADVRTQILAQISRSNAPNDPIGRAVTAAEEVQGAEQLSFNSAFALYSLLARTDVEFDDRDIEKLALTKMAQAALDSRNSSELIQAGLEWSKFESNLH